MAYYTPVEFFQLATDSNNTPFAVLKELGGSREIKVAVSGYDANRLAISSFKVLDIPFSDISSTIIDVLGGTLLSVKLIPIKEGYINCSLEIKDISGVEKSVTCRPGEGVFLANSQGVPIFAEETLFKGGEIEFSLKKRVRELQTDQFATFRLGA